MIKISPKYIKIDQSGKLMQFQYIDHSYLEINIVILFTTLT